MANTYTQIHIHIIFAVANRQSLIHAGIKDRLHKYITGIIQRRGHKLLAINGMPDHIHILIGLRPETALSDLVRDIKAHSAKHVNEEKWLQRRFAWQKGYGAFSYARSQLSTVIEYIRNQEEHHRKRTFQKEYLRTLQLFDVQYDPKRVFERIEGG